MNFGFKISGKGSEVQQASLKDLIVNSSHPQWKCDLRPNPKHFGILKATVSLAAGETKTLLAVKHDFTYTPSFIVAWSYPAGDSVGSTYGLGDIEIFDAGDVPMFKTRVNATNLVITADNSTGLASHNLVAQLRYYIFADDFPIYTYAPITL